MSFEMLKPLGLDFLNYVDGLPSQALGKKVNFFKGGEFKDFDRYQIAILGVNDNRGAGIEGEEIVDIVRIRKVFYSLFPGNWSSKIIDLGDVVAGQSLEDTYFLVRKIVFSLLKNNVLCVILGGSQDLTYAVYRAYDEFEQMVNLVTIDSKLDLARESGAIAENYLSKVIMAEPTNLFNFSNLGYQTYFNSQEEIDLIENLYFEAYRVGEISKNIQLAEPVLRDADIVSLDLNAIKSSDSGNTARFNPNGFDGREICTLARYAGLSDRVSSFGIFNYNNLRNETLLIGQILWYFIEGYNYRFNEYPYIAKDEYFKYIVPVEGFDDFVFYKSNVSERWWIEFVLTLNLDSSAKKRILLPCSKEDYELTIAQEVSDRWMRVLKKGFI